MSFFHFVLFLSRDCHFDFYCTPAVFFSLNGLRYFILIYQRNTEMSPWVSPPNTLQCIAEHETSTTDSYPVAPLIRAAVYG